MNLTKRPLISKLVILFSTCSLLFGAGSLCYAADEEEEKDDPPAPVETTPAQPETGGPKAATPKPGESVEQLLATSKDFVHREKYQQAQQPLKRALELSPNNMAILKELYEVSTKARDWSNTLSALEQILALDPSKEKDLYADYGQVLFNLHKYDKAKTVLKKALSFGKDKDKIFRALVKIAVLEKEDILAEEYYLEFFKVAPKDADLRLQYASYLRKRGKVKEAIPHLRIASEGLPNDSRFHETFAYLLLTEKDYNGSLEEYKRAMACAPTGSVQRIQVAYKFAAAQQRAAQKSSGTAPKAAGATELPRSLPKTAATPAPAKSAPPKPAAPKQATPPPKK